jgi:hypothetical protein
VARLTLLLAEWAAASPATEVLSDALLRACAPLTDEQLRALPGSPEDAAAALRDSPFADRAEGAYLAFEWLESFCGALRLPIAELENGWDVSDGEDVYFCPRVLLADDPDAPEDTRAYVRVDQITRWPEPRPLPG